VKVPAGATVVDCAGLFLLAGFQNSHVHFTETKWEGAALKPAAQLSAQLREMLLRYGFTTVVDTGSVLANTIALRKRVESREVSGPRILTAGTPLYPESGIPYYLKTLLPPEVLALLNTPKTPEAAVAISARQLAAGGDAVKLFTGSWFLATRPASMEARHGRRTAPPRLGRGGRLLGKGQGGGDLGRALAGEVEGLHPVQALEDGPVRLGLAEPSPRQILDLGEERRHPGQGQRLREEPL